MIFWVSFCLFWFSVLVEFGLILVLVLWAGGSYISGDELLLDKPLMHGKTDPDKVHTMLRTIFKARFSFVFVFGPGFGVGFGVWLELVLGSWGYLVSVFKCFLGLKVVSDIIGFGLDSFGYGLVLMSDFGLGLAFFLWFEIGLVCMHTLYVTWYIYIYCF